MQSSSLTSWLPAFLGVKLTDNGMTLHTRYRFYHTRTKTFKRFLGKGSDTARQWVRKFERSKYF
jgi:hypothetical protein